MPNWVKTNCWATGPEDQLADFEKRMIGPDERDELKNGDLLFKFSELIKPPANEETMTAREWIDWATRHWGTKWEGQSVSVKRRSPGLMKFSFETAWSFPAPVFRKLVMTWKGLVFRCEYADEDLGNNCGTYFAAFDPASGSAKERLASCEGDRGFACKIWGFEDDTDYSVPAARPFEDTLVDNCLRNILEGAADPSRVDALFSMLGVEVANTVNKRWQWRDDVASLGRYVSLALIRVLLEKLESAGQAGKAR